MNYCFVGVVIQNCWLQVGINVEYKVLCMMCYIQSFCKEFLLFVYVVGYEYLLQFIGCDVEVVIGVNEFGMFEEIFGYVLILLKFMMMFDYGFIS